MRLFHLFAFVIAVLLAGGVTGMVLLQTPPKLVPKTETKVVYLTPPCRPGHPNVKIVDGAYVGSDCMTTPAPVVYLPVEYVPVSD
jgi:hypothetical protein